MFYNCYIHCCKGNKKLNNSKGPFKNAQFYFLLSEIGFFTKNDNTHHQLEESIVIFLGFLLIFCKLSRALMSVRK